ncbi:hypothetical protein GCM10010971_12260 [Silvimonas amylolytica]|uniref:Uncharacterized protein n=1 Tax=Silvimonas amylolytica TaxID=449663 RepID=A0ABQ2PIH1_9NEIS|nr:hypothetical protein GCM10010971_12260 [Silvimonas amylolytica]
MLQPFLAVRRKNLINRIPPGRVRVKVKVAAVRGVMATSPVIRGIATIAVSERKVIVRPSGAMIAMHRVAARDMPAINRVIRATGTTGASERKVIVRPSGAMIAMHRVAARDMPAINRVIRATGTTAASAHKVIARPSGETTVMRRAAGDMPVINHVIRVTGTTGASARKVIARLSGVMTVMRRGVTVLTPATNRVIKAIAIIGVIARKVIVPHSAGMTATPHVVIRMTAALVARHPARAGMMIARTSSARAVNGRTGRSARAVMPARVSAGIHSVIGHGAIAIKVVINLAVMATRPRVAARRGRLKPLPGLVHLTGKRYCIFMRLARGAWSACSRMNWSALVHRPFWPARVGLPLRGMLI